MTKRKTLYLWGLLLLFLGIINSCRNDYLQEYQANEEIRNSQLKSQIISLNQSLHKQKLLGELSESKNILNKPNFKNALRKNISFGDSITINTDHVIYIENGPNYHTYTFGIERPNALPNDPVENLLLSPLPDGSYQEFLVMYNFTEQEKNTIRNGGIINMTGKTKVTELLKGTFNSNGQLAKTTMVCGWNNSIHWALCSEGIHGESTYGSCQFVGDFVDNAGNPGFPPYPYLVSTYSCVEEVDETLAPTNPGGSGGGGGGNSGNPPNDDCSGVASNPGEVGIVDENGCNVGIVTQPIIRPKDNPCETIKKSTTDAKYKAHEITLRGKGNLDNEVGYKLSNPIPNTGQNGTQDQIMENYPGTNRLNFNASNYTFAFLHSHHDNLYPIFSPDDILALNSWIKGVIDYNNNPNNLPKINIRELTISVVTTNGTYLISFDGTTIESFPNYTQTQWDKLIDRYIEFMKDAGNPYDQNYMEKLEKQFLKFSEKYMPMPGMKLYEVQSSGNIEIYLENGNRKTKPCP